MAASTETPFSSSTEPINRADAALIDSDLPPVRFWLLSVGISLGLLMAMLDTSIIATSLLTIGQEFKSLDRVNWVVLSYTLAYLGCAVLFARVADVAGRRDAFLAAFVVFLAFSIGCGCAQSLEQLLVCRALQGVGGSGLYSLSMIIWPELAPNHLKQYIAALAGLVVAVAGVLGPVLGGILTQYASWRWVFWINGPIGIVSLAVFYLSWPKEHHLPSIEKRSWKDVDYVGSVLLVVAAVLVTFAFQSVSRNPHGWQDAGFIAPVAVGGTCWVLLFAWEWLLESRDGGDRIMAAFPLLLVRNHVYSATLLNTALMGFAFFVTLFAMPLRLQVVNGRESLMAGVLLLPMLAGVAIGSFAGGAISRDRNRICETLVAGSCLTVLGTALETTISDSQELDPRALGFLVFIGLGFGISASCSTMIGIVEAPVREHAPAQGITAQMRVFGGSLGIAASSVILAREVQRQLGGELTAGQLAAVETRGPAGIAAGGDTSGQDMQRIMALVRRAYADAFRHDMVLAAAVGAFAVVAALCTYRRGRVSLLEARRRHAQDELERRRHLRVAPSPGEESESTVEAKQASV
ncbi:hypothetical protein MAPG_04986 [Magnaporthiopsis poae ATCC 64411]|uniref:Major facilitator superfamily (MFS) profile domain-containing protein n=1 Tax=Magnaporthiopsis poae (strain ATCC 64411 / 73-15) TaxID=644358 RepID=A0A0C4DY75_MAGP6|nr:hypothetical protein MAPG_04986 [Magnaporthiopsis poae ATCC 64411]